jgi:transcriptional regulator
MYTPPAFRMDDLPEMHEVMRTVQLSTLVTATEQGLLATPLPLILVPDEGQLGTLYGHLARANPQWTLPAMGNALALFTGPDAYITPSWYATKKEHGRVVPTWNYVAIHAYGEAEFFEDPARLLDVVTRLTNLHEASRAEQWAVTDAPESYIRSQLKGIIGLRLPIIRIEGKVKASQNRPEADRIGVALGLDTEGGTSQLMANLVRTRGA